MHTKSLFSALSLVVSLLPAICFADYAYNYDRSEVTDMETGLIWRRCAEGQAWDGSTCTGPGTTYTHEAALARAKSEADRTGKPWRLPNVNELHSIAKTGEAATPSIDTVAFPLTSNSPFWSSSTDVGDSGYAWVVNFNYGGVYDLNLNYYGYVRLVR